MHHSFVQLPDGNYAPRKFDPRSSFNNSSYYDYSSSVSEPIEKYVINRHRLSKKDPSAKISEPVKPIVYYLDNGTPEPIRTALLKGGNWWNQAFEAAGYKDAFVVKMLPDKLRSDGHSLQHDQLGSPLLPGVGVMAPVLLIQEPVKSSRARYPWDR